MLATTGKLLEGDKIQERDLIFLLHFAEDWAKNLLDISEKGCRDILDGKG